MSHTETTWGRDFRSIDAIRQSFNFWSTTYETDLQATGLAERFHARVKHLVSPKFPIHDIGCGPGNSGKHWIPLGHELHGYDLSNGMLEAALRNQYSSATLLNLCQQDEVHALSSMPQAICVGVLGDYVPAPTILPLLLQKVTGPFLFTIEAKHVRTNYKVLRDLIATHNVTRLGRIRIQSRTVCPELLYVFARS